MSEQIDLGLWPEEPVKSPDRVRNGTVVSINGIDFVAMTTNERGPCAWCGDLIHRGNLRFKLPKGGGTNGGKDSEYFHPPCKDYYAVWRNDPT